ncbi:MAG: class I SAM-dependent RNA methyltransferase [Bacteroidia bacterium]|nr:class I SAM-dependent RNA methyltransferase [Bacteroidia bacterium]
MKKKENSSDFKIVVSTTPGFEDLLAGELMRLGGRQIERHTRSVSCVGDQGFLYKINLNLRTGLRVLKPIAKTRAASDKELYENIKKIDWSQYMEKDGTLWIESTLNSEFFNHTQYVAQVTKDAIVDQFRGDTGIRPNVEKERADLKINIHIYRDEVTVSLDASGESLYKRGYRTGTNLAPLSEVLAAGMVMMSGWERHIQLIDPMTGSGTIAIEAAMIANNIPAGYFREDFGFMRWKDYDSTLWDLIFEKSIERITDHQPEIFASDISANVLKKAKENVKNAKVDDVVQLKCASFFDLAATKERGYIIMNPPYGERMEKDDVPALYKEIGDKLKKDFPGYSAWILSSNMEALKKIGLHHTRRVTLFNGALECKYMRYDMYPGTKKIHKLDKSEEG